MFRGRYQHAIDPKGRLSVPSKYRDVLAQYDGSTLIVVPMLVHGEVAIQVHPLEEWERIERDLTEKSSMFDAEARRVGRLYISLAKEVEPDGAGRILLPPDTRKEAGIGRDVTLVGPGRKYFEIWDRERLEEYDRANFGELSAAFQRLADKNI
jgi:transcriptional regulator MraZ